MVPFNVSEFAEIYGILRQLVMWSFTSIFYRCHPSCCSICFFFNFLVRRLQSVFETRTSPETWENHQVLFGYFTINDCFPYRFIPEDRRKLCLLNTMGSNSTQPKWFRLQHLQQNRDGFLEDLGISNPDVSFTFYFFVMVYFFILFCAHNWNQWSICLIRYHWLAWWGTIPILELIHRGVSHVEIP